MLINGTDIATSINQTTAQQVKTLSKQAITPHLGVILVGDDKPSETYVKKKLQLANRLGIKASIFRFPAMTDQETLLAHIATIQTPDLDGLIVQLPLPYHLDKQVILNAVHPNIDIDCLNEINTAKLSKGTAPYIPPTPQAIMEILRSINVSPKNKKITIIGKGALVGKPLAALLKHKNAHVTVCDKTTKNTAKHCLDADIIVTGVGCGKYLVNKDMVHKESIVIDSGIWFEGKKMRGDVDVASIKDIVSYYTPTPGGVGPVTVACLLRNVVLAAAGGSGEV